MRSTCKRLMTPLLAVTAITLWLFSGFVYAELPASADILPTGASEDKPVDMIIFVLLIGAQIFAVLLGLAAVGYSGFSIVTSFGEASKRGEWGTFISTTVGGVTMIGIGVTLAVLLFTYASSFTADVTVASNFAAYATVA